MEKRDESGRRDPFDLGIFSLRIINTVRIYWGPAVYLGKLHEFMRVGDLEILQHGFNPGCPAYNLLAGIVETRGHFTRIASVEANKMEIWCLARHGDRIDADEVSEMYRESIYCG